MEEDLLLRVLGTDEPRKGTEDGPLSCDDELVLVAGGAAELASVTMTVVVMTVVVMEGSASD